jgi:hypothetical protein
MTFPPSNTQGTLSLADCEVTTMVGEEHHQVSPYVLHMLPLSCTCLSCPVLSCFVLPCLPALYLYLYLSYLRLNTLC